MPMILYSLSFFIAFAMLGGCASRAYQPMPESSARVSHVPGTPGQLTFPVATESTASSQSKDLSDQERLNLLRQQRTQQHAATDYPVGPGDLLEVTVGSVEELNNRAVRVSGQGTITLPFVGVVQVSGLTEDELREELR